MTRRKNVFFNVGFGFISNIVKCLFTFITRMVFIYCLGKEALGLNGLFTNVLTMLSLTELGIGSAISFSLYKPLANNDNDNISALMSFYKRAYRIIGLIILVIGIVIAPFLRYIINDINSIENVYLIYILFLLNTDLSYFISYKETLIIADQKKYKLTIIEVIGYIVLNILQIVFLLLTKNYIVYLIIQIIVLLVQRLFINKYISKMYPSIDFDSNKKVSENDMVTIKKNVKAMFFHKVGDVCINGTDNVIISSFIDLVTVGLYSNYLTIINMINSFTIMIFSSMSSSVGNLLISESEEKKYYTFNLIDFGNYLIYGYCSIVLLCVFNLFIELWADSSYCLSQGVVILIVISFYITGRRVSPSIVKQAAGLYDDDKFTPIIQAIVNLTFSIILAKLLGISGVILGTIISSIILPSWQRPYLVYKNVLHRSSKEYFMNYIKQIIQLLLIAFISYSLINCLKINNIYISFVTKTIIVSFIYIVVTCLINYKNIYLKEFISIFSRKVIKWKKN